MQRFLIASLFIIAATTAQAEPPAYAASLAELKIGAEGDPRPLRGHIIYPSTGGSQTMRFGENAVWRGFDVYPDAPRAEGRFPLVVLSHGLDGNSFNQAWLATALAESGFIVVAPNHPGTTTRDRDPKQRAALWERPHDISRTISAMLAHPIFGDAIAKDRIAAIGHSLGGYTVLALAGAHYSTARETADCGEHPDRADCVFVREAGIGADPKTTASLEASLRDPRIAAVVSLDLGLTQAFDRQSLSKIDIPVLVFGAGREDMLDLDAESRALAAALPPGLVRYVELADAGHFDFVGVCKPAAEEILKEEEPGDEMVCKAGGAERDALHAVIIEKVKAFLAGAGLGAD
jgi:predicted dienelactone hydrolase